MVQLQQKFDALGRANNAHSAEALGERDSAHMRSLQQRLEQLVAVHRQLLRKFASLELETVELKKKTQLRDERIRQLEGSSRGLISNIRQQAERHVAELTHLREQMTVSYFALKLLWWTCLGTEFPIHGCAFQLITCKRFAACFIICRCTLFHRL
jgi:predicted  nucleic acid-binding Zn-ribbon protein